MYFSTGAQLQAALSALPTSKVGSYVAFDASFYSATYMGAYTGTLTPIEHFVQIGTASGAKPNADFDPAFYASQYADLQGKGFDAADLIYHFMQYGLDEGRAQNATYLNFDGNAYLAAYPDVKAYVEANLDQFGGSLTNGAIAHFVKFGEAEGRVAPGVTPGETFTLTTGTDAPQLTSGNDTITAAAGELNNTDVLVDFSTTDNDTLNATINADNLAPTIRNIENVNLSLDVFDGANATFNAVNVLGATITMSSSKLGFNGVAEVDNATTNNVTAGTNVTNLTVAGVTTGTVNTGSATTASVTTAAATDTAKITVNGDIALTAATATTAVINATAAAEIDLTAAAVTKLTVNGAHNVTIVNADDDLDGDEIVNGLTAGTLIMDVVSDARDGSDWDVDVVRFSNVAVNTFTARDAAVIELTLDDTVAITGQSATTGTLTVNTDVDQTSLTLATLASATINVTGEADAIATLSGATTAMTVNVADDLTITTLTGGNTKTQSFTGTGDVTVVNGTALTVDASALNGALDYTQATDVATTVKGGKGNNTVVLAGTTIASAYVGNTGNDTLSFATTTGTASADLSAGGTNEVTATALTTGTLAVTGGAGADTVIVAATGAATIALDLGAGDDVVDVTGDINTAATVAIAFGAGTADTLKVTGVDVSDVTFSLTGLEIIKGGSVATTVVSSALVSGKTYTVAAAGTGEGLTVKGTAAANTIDLSTLSFDATLSNGANTMIIWGGDGIDTISLSSVKDTVVLSNDAAGNQSVITGFSIANDRIGIDESEFATINFANTGAGSAAGTALVAGDYNEIAAAGALAGDSINIITTAAGYASYDAAFAAVTAGAGNETIIGFYNNTTGKFELYFDADDSDNAGEVLIAQIDIVGADVASLSAANFALF